MLQISLLLAAHRFRARLLDAVELIDAQLQAWERWEAAGANRETAAVSAPPSLTYNELVQVGIVLEALLILLDTSA
jgi:hypothetical protein